MTLAVWGFDVTANKKYLLAGVALLIAGAYTAGASAQVTGSLNAAQQASSSSFARDRNVSVRQRPREGYEALGIRVGTFMAWPKIAASIESNDNIYAASVGERDDIVWRIEPELQLNSTWSRHALSAYARGSINRYADYDSENSEDWTVGADGRIDLLRTAYLAGGANFASQTEPRTSASSPGLTAEPIEYDTNGFYAMGVTEFNRLRLSARYDWTKWDYSDGRTVAGAVVDQDDRDREISILTGRAEYAVSPDTSIFVEASTNTRDYRLRPALPAINRDSDGYMVLAGANFDLSNVMRGEIGLGYLKQRYDDARLEDNDGFGARAQVEWFPSELTTITVAGSRTIEESGIPGTAGYLSTNLSARVDHELMRNVIISAGVNRGTDEYSGRNIAAARAFDREDTRTGLELSGTYLFNRNLGLTVGYNHTNQETSGRDAPGDFTVNRIGAKLTLQY